MKKIWYCLLAVFMIILLLNLFQVVTENSDDFQSERVVLVENKDVVDDPVYEIIDNVDEEIELSVDEDSVKEIPLSVEYVFDGDTVRLSTGERVRLICINTPEENEPYYQEAKDYLNNLLLNKEVTIEKDVSDKDMHGRLLRYIYLDGEFVNELIVKKGFGVAYPFNPDTKLCPEIEDAEEYAKSRKLGLWKN